MILYGAVAVVGTVLAGPTTYAVSARRRAAPVMNDRPGIVWGVAATAFLLLLLWGGTHALRSGGGSSSWAACSRPVSPRCDGRACSSFRAPAWADDSVLAHAHVTAPADRSPAAEIARLRDLRDSGAITDAEFERGKKLALSS